MRRGRSGGGRGPRPGRPVSAGGPAISSCCSRAASVSRAARSGSSRQRSSSEPAGMVARAAAGRDRLAGRSARRRDCRANRRAGCRRGSSPDDVARQVPGSLPPSPRRSSGRPRSGRRNGCCRGARRGARRGRPAGPAASIGPTWALPPTFSRRPRAASARRRGGAPATRSRRCRRPDGHGRRARRRHGPPDRAPPADRDVLRGGRVDDDAVAASRCRGCGPRGRRSWRRRSASRASPSP